MACTTGTVPNGSQVQQPPYGVSTQLPAAFSYLRQAGKMDTELLSLQLAGM
jgi:hypothetical protein